MQLLRNANSGGGPCPSIDTVGDDLRHDEGNSNDDGSPGNRWGCTFEDVPPFDPRTLLAPRKHAYKRYSCCDDPFYESPSKLFASEPLETMFFPEFVGISMLRTSSDEDSDSEVQGNDQTKQGTSRDDQQVDSSLHQPSIRASSNCDNPDTAIIPLRKCLSCQHLTEASWNWPVCLRRSASIGIPGEAKRQESLWRIAPDDKIRHRQKRTVLDSVPDCRSTEDSKCCAQTPGGNSEITVQDSDCSEWATPGFDLSATCGILMPSPGFYRQEVERLCPELARKTKNVDIVGRLWDSQALDPLHRILSNMSAKDLVKFSHVSNKWRAIVKSFAATSRRRHRYLKMKRRRHTDSKENSRLTPISKKNTIRRVTKRSRRPAAKNREKHEPLSTVCNRIETNSNGWSDHTNSSPYQQLSTVQKSVAPNPLDLFDKSPVKHSDRKYSRKPCPKCRRRCLVDDTYKKGTCQYSHCRFRFCTLCLDRYHPLARCRSPTHHFPRTIKSFSRTDNKDRCPFRYGVDNI